MLAGGGGGGGWGIAAIVPRRPEGLHVLSETALLFDQRRTLWRCRSCLAAFLQVLACLLYNEFWCNVFVSRA